MDRARLSLVAALLVVAACDARAPVLDEEEARAKIEALLAASSESPPAILQMRALPHSFRATVKSATAAEGWVELYLSRDGTTLFRDAVPYDAELARVKGGRRFVDCLLEAGVSLLVDPASPETAAELATLGATSERLAIDCSREPNNCEALGVRTLPTLRHRGELFPGRHTRAWLETRTGCK